MIVMPLNNLPRRIAAEPFVTRNLREAVANRRLDLLSAPCRYLRSKLLEGGFRWLGVMPDIQRAFMGATNRRDSPASKRPNGAYK